jgi:hypothetical protein
MAQDHEFRRTIHGKTFNALRRRHLIDKEHELTELGWTCYLELTAAGPCITNRIDGFVSKNPQVLYEKAKPRLEARARHQDSVKTKSVSALSNESTSGISAKSIFSLMRKDELDLFAVKQMSEKQQIALVAWMLRHVKSAGNCVFEVDDIKYNGRLVVLNDKSRWEVDDLDAHKTARWSKSERVAIVDGSMFRLKSSEKVAVEEET